MAANLPDYIASAQPVPQANRVAWFKSTAQTYAGIMLWFVFGRTFRKGMEQREERWSKDWAWLWSDSSWPHCFAISSTTSCLACSGMKTGLPLYIVGNVDVRRDWWILDARVSDGRATVRLARCERVFFQPAAGGPIF